MLLKRLVEYTERLDLPPVMYQSTPIRWIIDLDKAGNLAAIVSTSSGKRNDRGKEMLAPTLMRSSGVRAKLLCDNGEYVLGVARESGTGPPDAKKLERVGQCHLAFVDLVGRCARETREPEVSTVLAFVEKLDASALNLPAEFNSGDTMTFRVDGSFPMDLPSVRSFWAKETRPDDEVGGGQSRCLVCGTLCTPTDRMPVKIKGVPGGQTSGMTLVSANAAAFESFGLEASLISPICHQCAELHAKGANDLIGSEQNRIYLGPLVYVFWTRSREDFSFASLLSDPQPDEVRQLLRAPQSGRAATTIQADEFYAAAFSASGGRVVVRDWVTSTIGTAQANIRRWFRLQRLVHNNGGESTPLGLFPLASSLVRDVRKDLSPEVSRVLLHAALHGGPLPWSLLFAAVKRNRAEQAITRPRAAVIKMVMLTQLQQFEEETMVELDPENRDPAYLCGRLLAVLESVQYAALGKTNTTITNRFYGTASSAPASVFGRLLRGAQPHLGKLRTQKLGAYEALQRRLEEVQEHLPNFPLVLTLQQQGLFALGYYHQRACDRAARLAHSAENEGADPGPDSTKEVSDHE